VIKSQGVNAMALNSLGLLTACVRPGLAGGRTYRSASWRRSRLSVRPYDRWKMRLRIGRFEHIEQGVAIDFAAPVLSLPKGESN
jgi:hypothetical protein